MISEQQKSKVAKRCWKTKSDIHSAAFCSFSKDSKTNLKKNLRKPHNWRMYRKGSTPGNHGAVRKRWRVFTWDSHSQFKRNHQSRSGSLEAARLLILTCQSEQLMQGAEGRCKSVLKDCCTRHEDAWNGGFEI